MNLFLPNHNFDRVLTLERFFRKLEYRKSKKLKMRRLLLTLFAVSFLSIYCAAQSTGELRALGGLALGTESGLNNNGNRTAGLGVNIGAEYFVTEQISVAPNYTLFVPSKFTAPGIESTLRLSSLNIDGRYNFVLEGFEVYGMAGIAIAFARATFKSSSVLLPINQTTSDSDVGLNIGVGLNYPISDELRANVQAKYHTAFEMAVINIGVAYTL